MFLLYLSKEKKFVIYDFAKEMIHFTRILYTFMFCVVFMLQRKFTKEIEFNNHHCGDTALKEDSINTKLQ